MPVHVSMAEARALPGGRMPAHQAHAFLVFVNAADAASAAIRASRELAASGWYDVEVIGAKPVKADVVSGRPPEIQSAFEDAAFGGIGVVLFEEPVA